MQTLQIFCFCRQALPAARKKSVRKGILFGTQGKRCSWGDEMNVEMSLLEYLAYRAGCRWLSDLHCLDGCQRIRLHHVLEQLPPEAAPLPRGRRCWIRCAGMLAARGLTDGRKPRCLCFVCSDFVTAEKSS